MNRQDTLDFFGGNSYAADVYLKKYAITNRKGEIEEWLPSQMWRRLAKAAASIEKDSEYWEKEFYRILENWKSVPQGSIMFSLGNPYQKSSASNCYVIPILNDDIESIFDCAKEMSRTYSYRGGVGTDLSVLRPENAIVTNAARTSTGAHSFMDFYSYVTRLIGQHGRRGALMLTMSVDHPDIMKFITAKKDLTKVTGANISVKVSDKFMKAVEDDSDWELTFKTKHEVIKRTEKARVIWDLIITTATETAEPGILFWDRIINESPSDCYDNFKTTCTNPCCFAISDNIQVITKNGIKEIKDITSSDLIWVDSEKVFAKTSGYFKAGIAEIFKITLSNGQSFRVTSNHKFEIISEDNTAELVQLKDIKINDKISIDNTYHNFYNTLLNEIRVVSIEPDGVEETGCIEVEIYHKFTANGIVSGNSEIPLSNYDACTLLSQNLVKYTVNDFQKNAYFDFESFRKDVTSAVRFLDNTKEIDLNLMPLEKQQEAGRNGRRIGMGTHGLADALANLCIKYDSDEGIKFVDKLYEFFAKTVYQASVDLAKIKGPFPIFDSEKEKNNPFLNRIGFAGIPRRNIACLTCAPTGSVSSLCQTSSGIEPVFRNFYTRRRKINHNEAASVDKNKLHKDQLGDLWQEYTIAHHNVQRYLDMFKVEVKDLPDYFVESNNINWKQRVIIQATMQKWIDHAISSTTNLPKGTTVDTVKEIYMEAYKSGCKGFTVYVDGCREGVLISNETKNPKINKTDAPKRPKILDSDVYHIKVNNQYYFVIVGLLEEEPYEVFAGANGFIDHKVKKAKVTKIKRGYYKAELDNGQIIDNIATHITDEQAAITRLISLSLRHGADIKHCVSVLEKVPGDMLNFSKSMARALKNYIKNGEKVNGTTCKNCNSENLIRSEGCILCLDCGMSGCN